MTTNVHNHNQPTQKRTTIQISIALDIVSSSYYYSFFPLDEFYYNSACLCVIRGFFRFDQYIPIFMLKPFCPDNTEIVFEQFEPKTFLCKYALHEIYYLNKKNKQKNDRSNIYKRRNFSGFTVNFDIFRTAVQKFHFSETKRISFCLSHSRNLFS